MDHKNPSWAERPDHSFVGTIAASAAILPTTSESTPVGSEVGEVVVDQPWDLLGYSSTSASLNGLKVLPI